MEAALFANKRGLKAEVGLLHLVADADQVLNCVLALVQAAVDQSRVRGPVGVVHDMVEDLVDLQGRAAFALMQNGGVDSEGSGDLDAVDTGNRAGLLNGQDLRTQLACADGSHEAGTAAADDADVHIIGLVSACSHGNRAAQPLVRITAGLRDTVRDGFLDGAGGVGGTGDAVQTKGLILHDGGDQLILNLREEDRRLVLGDDVDLFQGGLAERAFHRHIAQVAVSGGLIGAGLVGSLCLGCGNARNAEGGKADGTGSGALQKVTTSQLFAHSFSPCIIE